MVAGFEPLDILQSIHQLMVQLAEGRCEVENQYGRVVPWDGNRRALEVVDEVMELRDTFEWRGLGVDPGVGAAAARGLRRVRRGAAVHHPGPRASPTRRRASAATCCKGALEPWECGVFGTACTPETPIGTCMVSSEGACAAYYNYGRFSRSRTRGATSLPDPVVVGR